jgi:hypothetical protein
MDFVLALMVVLGCVFLEIGEFKGGKDVRLLGFLLGLPRGRDSSLSPSPRQ